MASLASPLASSRCVDVLCSKCPFEGLNLEPPIHHGFENILSSSIFALPDLLDEAVMHGLPEVNLQSRYCVF